MTSTVNPVKMAKNGDYLTLSEVEAYGEAPGVTWKLLSDIGGRQTYAVVFKIGDEIATGLRDAYQAAAAQVAQILKEEVEVGNN